MGYAFQFDPRFKWSSSILLFSLDETFLLLRIYWNGLIKALGVLHKAHQPVQHLHAFKILDSAFFNRQPCYVIERL